MTDDPKNQPTNDSPIKDITRRDFAVLVVGAGLAATIPAAAAADLELIETDVEIKTPDGTCDAAFIRPKSGSHPGVLIWPDAIGSPPFDARHRAAYRCRWIFSRCAQSFLSDIQSSFHRCLHLRF